MNVGTLPFVSAADRQAEFIRYSRTFSSNSSCHDMLALGLVMQFSLGR